MNDQLERDLTDGLRAIATHAPAGGGWNAIHGRIARRQRARRRRRAAVAAAITVAVAGGLASTVDGDGRRQVVAGPPAAPAGLPRLVVDQVGFRVVRAVESPDGPATARDTGTLAVLARPDAGLSGPALFVRTVPSGASYGFGEQSPTARTVDIGGRTGFLMRYTSLSRSLGWQLADGSGIHLISLRLSDDDLLVAARAMERVAGATTWAPDAMPAGLVRLRETPGGEAVSPATAETDYVGEKGAGMQVRVQAGGQHVVDDYVLDRAASARQVSEVRVDGAPAVLSVYEEGDRRSLIWAVRPGFMAEIDGTGLTDGQLVEAAESVRVAGDEEWRKLLAIPVDPGPGQLPANIDAIADLAKSRCVLRDEWLAAVRDGDGRAAGPAVAKLTGLIARYRAEGIEPNGDIFVVVDRLIAAMRSGSVAAVEAQACN